MLDPKVPAAAVPLVVGHEVMPIQQSPGSLVRMAALLVSALVHFGFGAICLVAPLGWLPASWGVRQDLGATGLALALLLLLMGAGLGGLPVVTFFRDFQARRFFKRARERGCGPDDLLAGIDRVMEATIAEATDEAALTRLGLMPLRESPLLQTFGATRPQQLCFRALVEGVRSMPGGAGDEILLAVTVHAVGSAIPVRAGFWLLGKDGGGGWALRRSWPHAAGARGPAVGAHPPPRGFELQA